MSHLTMLLLIAGAFALILGTAKAVRAYLENRSEEMAFFRRYYLPEHDRQFLRESSWSDGEDPYDRRTRIDALNGPDQRTTETYLRGGGTTGRNRDRD